MVLSRPCKGGRQDTTAWLLGLHRRVENQAMQVPREHSQRRSSSGVYLGSTRHTARRMTRRSAASGGTHSFKKRDVVTRKTLSLPPCSLRTPGPLSPQIQYGHYYCPSRRVRAVSWLCLAIVISCARLSQLRLCPGRAHDHYVRHCLAVHSCRCRAQGCWYSLPPA
jgi:hypothetical protein